ncbi:MAG: PHP domain-containing protein [Clostridia bacterium]|nr:PHP domain-containing protein [Clostridia bacterium]
MNAIKLKQKLEKKYPYRIELHAHTKPHSWCGEAKPEELVKIYAEKGFDGVVITNHFMSFGGNKEYLQGDTKEEKIKFYLSAYEEAKKTGEKLGLKVYLGIEIRFSKESDNDYLIYGADEEIASLCYDNFGEDLEYFRKNVNLPKSVFLQAHPFRDNITAMDPELLDGVETFNMHPGHNSRVGFACRYAKENNLKIRTAGSDFHHLGRNHEGVSALRTKVLPKDSFHLAQILKSGDYVFEIGETAIVLP